MLKNPQFLLVLLAALTGHIAWAQAPAWQKVSLDSLVSVEFPAAPTKQEVQGQQVYVANEDGTIYMVLAQKNAFKENPTPTELMDFYNGMEEGVLQEAGGGQLTNKSTFTINGFTGVEAQFTTPTRPSLPAVKFMRILLVNNTAYTQNFWTSTEKEASSQESRQRFFASLRPSVQQTAAATGSRKDAASYKFGYVLGQLGMVALLIGGVVWVVRRFRRPRKTA